MIIDIHSHLIEKDGHYDVEALLQDMKKYNIEKRVFSIPNAGDIKKGNDYASTLAKKYPDKLIASGYLNPKSPNILEDLDHMLALENIKIVEMNSYEDSYYPDSQKHVRQVLEKLAKNKVVVKVFTGIGAKSMPHQWEHVAKEIEGLEIIYLHMGCFDYGYSCVDVVERNDNAFIETSNQYEMQILRKAFANLDIKKIVFGSSYPNRFTSNAIDIFDLFNLTDSQKDQVFYENTKKLLQLD